VRPPRHETRVSGENALQVMHPDLCPTKRWKLGDVTITCVMEFPTQVMNPEDLLQTTRAAVLEHGWLQGDFATEDGSLYANFQAFVIEAGGLKIMVDTCIGEGKPGGPEEFSSYQAGFLGRLEKAGFPPAAIDVVLCTHLHFDHCGWNTIKVGDRWVPTFPNARYLFAREELAHAEADAGEMPRAMFRDSVKPIFDAGLADIVERDHVIVDEVRLEPSPGHTPGHCCVIIASRGHEAVITGDAIHHPMQACVPEVCSIFCFDADGSRRSRKTLLERASANGSMVLGNHFAGPTAVRVEVAPRGYRMKPA
jgi:glyoxylase-like metal-dependent hydrolase (beta-lactamase superfamily II)